ncbi:MAG: DNA polymerase III subunit beta [Candidatus Doudnabacteria bacterium]|nr:DNA polymerase III subunit beta [Candidatus Doudnabacteria bacterium]
MKVVCTKDNLRRGLFAVSRVVGSGNPLQVLNNILVKTDQGRVKLSSTNLEIGVNTWIGGKIEEEGALTVPARLMNEYINNLPADKVLITVKDTVLSLESENYHTNIKGLSSEDFPLIPQVLDEPYTKVDSDELKSALAETVWAAANNETQPEISGIFVAFEDNKLRIAATDRYRLAERVVPLAAAVATNKEAIIPSRTIGELYKILSLGKGGVEIYFSESQVLFKFDETEIISRLIDGNYPDYRQIIPKTFKTEAEVGKSELLHALKAASLFAPDSNNVQVEAGKTELTVAASSAAAGENVTKVAAAVKGDSNSAVFNFRYLIDCLNALPEEKVILKMINDASPAMLLPAGRDNYLYIVMPIKL